MTRSIGEIVHMNAKVDATSICVHFEEKARVMGRLGVAFVPEELRKLIKECIWSSIETVESTK